MTFKKRLAVLEKSARPLNIIPPIIVHILVQPILDGPKEVESFVQLETKGICQRIDCKAGETQRQFENRIQ